MPIITIMPLIHKPQLPDGEEKITLLGQITRMETARKDLQAQIYGNTVG